MNVVLDTNVLVSGFISPFGPPAAILRSVLTGRNTVCFDERILSEYRDVLTRGRFNFDRRRINEVLQIVEINGLPVLADALRLDLPDPSDAMFIEVAIAADADCLVTGNLKHFPVERMKTESESGGTGRGDDESYGLQDVRILTPREFLDRFLDRQSPH